ncbi:MAG: undecaprenyl-diphosphate phosphatase [Proteobacteria bacterium]|nr:undecaprenyl-diphosphate phosphatase [Pseudomonadota bacterium]
MDDIIKAILLGIVQGLTEFIPVSSTGHLILAGNILEFSGEFAKTFDIAIQLGSILAVIIIYKDNFREYIKPKPNLKIFPNIIHIIITTIPVLIIGVLLHNAIKQYLFTPFTVAIGLMLGSVLMLFADYYYRRTKNNLDIGYKKSFVVGLFQCLALWPGMSRSGATISGGIFSGMDHKKAAGYSFICAVPAMFAATGYELLKTSHAFTLHEFFLLAIGFVVSFAVGWASILFLIRLVSKIKLMPFAIYRIILAFIILMLI